MSHCRWEEEGLVISEWEWLMPWLDRPSAAELHPHMRRQSSKIQTFDCSNTHTKKQKTEKIVPDKYFAETKIYICLIWTFLWIFHFTTHRNRYALSESFPWMLLVLLCTEVAVADSFALPKHHYSEKSKCALQNNCRFSFLGWHTFKDQLYRFKFLDARLTK